VDDSNRDDGARAASADDTSVSMETNS